MDQQTAHNGLAFIQRGAAYIPLTAQEAVAFADFVKALESEARGGGDNQSADGYAARSGGGP